MTYDFDGLIDRRGTDSVKWRLFGDDVLPMWVADMDFRSPEPVIRALCERVEHGIFGYGVEPPELREVLVQRLARLYGWAVPPEAIVFLPGVVVGLRAACRAVAGPATACWCRRRSTRRSGMPGATPGSAAMRWR